MNYKINKIIEIDVSVRLNVFTLFITTADAYIYKYLHYRTRCTLSNIGIQCPDVTSCGGLRYSLSSAGRSCGTNAPTDIVEPSVVFRTTREGRVSNVIFRSGFSSIRSRSTLFDISLVDLCALPMRQRHLGQCVSDGIMKDFVTNVHCARRSHIMLENISPHD